MTRAVLVSVLSAFLAVAELRAVVEAAGENPQPGKQRGDLGGDCALRDLCKTPTAVVETQYSSYPHYMYLQIEDAVYSLYLSPSRP